MGKGGVTSLIDSVKDKLRKVNKFYRFGDLPLALQIWIYECCSDVSGEIVVRVANKVLRILNWKVIKKKPGFSKLCKVLFNNKIIFSNISAMMEELGILHLLENEEYDLESVVHSSMPLSFMKQQQAATKNMNARSDNQVSNEKVMMSDFKNLRKDFLSFKDDVRQSLAKLSHGVLSTPPPTSNSNNHQRISGVTDCSFNQNIHEIGLKGDFEKLSGNFFSFNKFVMETFVKFFEENKDIRRRLSDKNKSEGVLSENHEKETPHKASESIFVHTRVEALKHVAEAVPKHAEVAEVGCMYKDYNDASYIQKDETSILSGSLRSGGQTSGFHDTTVDEVKRKTSFPSFDDWDYPIPTESQIVVCEKSFAQVPETPDDPTPLAQVSGIPADPTPLAQFPGISAVPTPLPESRIRCNGKYNVSPYVNQFGSASSSVAFRPLRFFNLKHPFTVEVGTEVDTKLCFSTICRQIYVEKI